MVETLNTREVSRIAGSAILDLANTVAWRLDPDGAIERLVDDETAVWWAEEFGLCTADEAMQLRAATSGGELVDGLREVREHVYAAAWRSDRTSAAALLELDRVWWSRVELEPSDDGWAPVERFIDGRTLVLRVTHRAVELLLSDLSDLKQCADAACGWLYLDTSPRRNRRWCAADDCGARNRSRDHYHRRHGVSP